jgi:3-oxoacyl-[acyl-carrier-protein] synthase-3
MGLHEAIRGGLIERGDRVLLLGTAAGLTLGGVVLDY